MSQERDTHFQNFAEMEFRDLTPELAGYLQALSVDNHPAMHRHQEAIKRILAQRAYDLVYHALEQASHGEHAFDAEIVFKHQVSDLTKWPE